MSSESSDLRQRDNLTREQAWLLYQESFLELLNPSDSEGITVYVFVNRLLQQFHLTGLYDPAYVLHAVYLRMHDYIWNRDGDIRNLTPWVKGTAINIIRELSRRERKTDSIEDINQWEQMNDPAASPQFNINDEFALIMLAFERLLPEDQRILRLATVEGLSYRDIRQTFVDQGQDIAEATLRKKKQRALKRLRDLYHQMANQEDCCS